MKKKNIAFLTGLGLTLTLASCGDKPEEVWRGDISELGDIVDLDIDAQIPSTTNSTANSVTSYVGEVITNDYSTNFQVLDQVGSILMVGNESAHIGFWSLTNQKYVVAPSFQYNLINDARVETTKYIGELLIVETTELTYYYDSFGNLLYKDKAEPKVSVTSVNGSSYVTFTSQNEDGTKNNINYEYSASKYAAKIDKLPNNVNTEAAQDTPTEKGTFNTIYTMDSKYSLADFGYDNLYVQKSGNVFTIFDKDLAKCVVTVPKGSVTVYIGQYLFYQESDIGGDELAINTYRINLVDGTKDNVKFGYYIKSATPYKDKDGVYRYAIAELRKLEKNKLSNTIDVYVIDSKGVLHDNVSDTSGIYPANMVKIGDNYYDKSTRIIYDSKLTPIAYIGDCSPSLNANEKLFMGYKYIDGVCYYGAIGYDGKIKIPFEYTSLTPLEYTIEHPNVNSVDGYIIGSKVDKNNHTQYYKINYKTGTSEYIGDKVTFLMDDLYWINENTKDTNAISFISQAKTYATIKATHGGELYVDKKENYEYSFNNTKYYVVTVNEKYYDDFNTEITETHYLTFAVDNSKNTSETAGNEVKTEENLGNTINDSIEIKAGSNEVDITSGKTYYSFTPEADGKYVFELENCLSLDSFKLKTNLGVYFEEYTYNKVNDKRYYIAELEKGNTYYLNVRNSGNPYKATINVSASKPGQALSDLRELSLGEDTKLEFNPDEKCYVSLDVPFDPYHNSVPVYITLSEGATIKDGSTELAVTNYDNDGKPFYTLFTGDINYFTIERTAKDAEISIKVSAVPPSALSDEKNVVYDTLNTLNPVKPEIGVPTAFKAYAKEYEMISYTNNTSEDKIIYYSAYTKVGDNVTDLYVINKYLIDSKGESEQIANSKLQIIKPGETLISYVYTYENTEVTLILDEALDNNDEGFAKVDKYQNKYVKYTNKTDTAQVFSIESFITNEDETKTNVNNSVYYSNDKGKFINNTSPIVIVEAGQTICFSLNNTNTNTVKTVFKEPISIVTSKDDLFNISASDGIVIGYKNTTGSDIIIETPGLLYKDSDGVAHNTNLHFSDAGIVDASGKSVLKSIIGNNDTVYLYYSSVGSFENCYLDIDIEKVYTRDYTEEEIVVTQDSEDKDYNILYSYVPETSGVFTFDFTVDTNNPNVDENHGFTIYEDGLFSSVPSMTKVNDVKYYYLEAGVPVYILAYTDYDNEESFEIKYKMKISEVKYSELNTENVENIEFEQYVTTLTIATSSHSGYMNFYAKGTVVSVNGSSMVIKDDTGIERTVEYVYDLDYKSISFNGSTVLDANGNIISNPKLEANMPTVGSFVYLYCSASTSIIKAAAIIDNPHTIMPSVFSESIGTTSIFYTEGELPNGKQSNIIYTNNYDIICSYPGSASSAAKVEHVDDDYVLTLSPRASEDTSGNILSFATTDSSTASIYTTLKLKLASDSATPLIMSDGKAVAPVEGVYTINSNNFTIINNTDSEVKITNIDLKSTYVINTNVNNSDSVVVFYKVTSTGYDTISLSGKKNSTIDSISPCYSVYINDSQYGSQTNLTGNEINNTIKILNEGDIVTIVYYYKGTADRDNTYGRNYNYTFTHKLINTHNELKLNEAETISIPKDDEEYYRTYDFTSTEDGMLHIDVDSANKIYKSYAIYEYDEEAKEYYEIGDSSSSSEAIDCNVSIKKGQKYAIVVSAKSILEEDNATVSYTFNASFRNNIIKLDDKGEFCDYNIHNNTLEYTAGESDELLYVYSNGCDIEYNNDKNLMSIGYSTFIKVSAGKKVTFYFRDTDNALKLTKASNVETKSSVTGDCILVKPVEVSGGYFMYTTVDKDSFEKGYLDVRLASMDLDVKIGDGNRFDLTISSKNTTVKKNADGTYTIRNYVQLDKNCYTAVYFTESDCNVIGVEFVKAPNSYNVY